MRSAAERLAARGVHALVADHHLVARHAFSALPKHRFGAVDGGGVEQVDAERKRLVHQATASASLLPVPSPSRLNPPQPSPATLTLSPVRPSVVNSISRSAAVRSPYLCRKPIDSQGIAATISSDTTSAPI